MKKPILMLIVAMVASACTTQKSADEGLKDALEDKFYIGAALNGPQILGDDTASLKILHKHFNSIVAENVMKSGPIHPREDEYRFDLPDKFVEFGNENDMYIVGHCLIWHSQAPRWFFTDDEGNDVSKEVLIERMKTHISTVVGRYKGKVDAWDVVNEAFEDDGSWRSTRFYEIIGEEYMELAFKFAHEADPDAEFLYNDYSMFHQGRREAVVKLVNDLKEKGIQIDGVGMQAHYGMDYPSIEDFEKSIVAFAETGVDVHITELDIDALPRATRRMGAEISDRAEYQRSLNPYPDGLPDSLDIALNERYMDFFDLFLKHHDKIKRVTLWGITDHQSWKNNWPVRGRTNYPLLFDRNYEAKPVVKKIIETAKETP
ncbi:MAG: endo-1,4-beta-xylanase [Bacteroidales bacterium]|nr:endo-1,4-beta-xylanase [Bacteroidales bacterium]